MDVYRAVCERSAEEHAFISITGGGGKTTFMIRCASYLRSIGKRVLMTTTTKVASPYGLSYGADRIFNDERVLDYRPEGPCTVFLAYGGREDPKWCSPGFEVLEKLRNVYDVVLNEADGSRHLPIKVHTLRDPRVPEFTTYTVSIAGLWAIGRSTEDAAFGEKRSMVVDRSYLNWYLSDSQGLLKGSIPGKRMIIWNGADDCPDLEVVRDLDYPQDAVVLAAALDKGELYEEIRQSHF